MARERREGSEMKEASGRVRAWEVDKAAESSGGVRKWFRRGASGSGRERDLLFESGETLTSETGAELIVLRSAAPSAERSRSAAEAVAGGGSAVSKDSRKGVGTPRIGSPSAAARSFRRTICRAILAARRASACLLA